MTNFKIYAFIFLVFILAGRVTSQEYHKVDLRWQGIETFQGAGLSFPVLAFDGATNHDSTGLLPVYQYRVPLTSEEVDCTVSLLDEVYDSVARVEMQFEDRELIRSNVKIFQQIDIQRKKKYLSIYILPLRSSPDGDILGLTSFTLSLTITPRSGGSRAGTSYASQSVLRDGSWYKFAVEQTGIHIITYEDLENVGIDVASLDPAKVGLFGNGNGMVPEPNSMSRYDDLTENAIFISGGQDGSFDPGDHILFYGMGPTEVRYSNFYKSYDQLVNIYSTQVYYFLTTDMGTGKRIIMANNQALTPTDTIDFYDRLIFHEEENVNIVKSGQEWYGEVFNVETSYEFNFTVPHLILDSTITFKTNLAARSTEDNVFTVFAEGSQLLTVDLAPINLISAIYARGATSRVETFHPLDETINIRIDYNKPNTTSTGWLNYITMNAYCHLAFDGGQMAFRNASVVADSSVGLFQIADAGAETRIWNVTNRFQVTELPFEPGTTSGHFISMVDTLKEFIAFDGTYWLEPKFIGPVANQNLHALETHEFLIVYYPEFKEQALRLKEFHEVHDGLSVLAVTPEEIFNEFSTGMKDPGAMRDFARMLYTRSVPGNELRYLMFFGDGSYDYKDRIENNHNLIPTFQSRESLKLASSYVTEDFFGCFDLSEGSNGSGNLDIGIGRLPVTTKEQARDVVDKMIHYAIQSDENNGKWRNRILFVADDGDNNIHLKQAEELTIIVDTTAPVYNVNKVYFDAYEQLKTPNGDRYPDVNKAIDKAVLGGSLIVNYTGHGGELGWGDERVLDIPMITKWDNFENLPAFVTATCEFSRFDDPSLTSGGELVLLNPKGGGIGLFTTTRLAYSQSNFGMNKKFYENAFRFDTVHMENMRMGDMLMHAKNPSNSNIRNIVLLGNPAIMLAFPKDSVESIQVTNDYVEQETDTLSALSKVTIKGRVTSPFTGPLSDFNGLLHTTVYDKPTINRTLGNDNSSKITDFIVQNKVLFQGTSTVTEGMFEFTFILPRDIGYYPDLGKISYYAHDTNTHKDAHGMHQIVIGGADDHAPADLTGPQIELYLNHYDFKNGDITTRDPVLIARLSDESGINLVSNGIGHDITLTINGDNNQAIVLNDEYEPYNDSYQEGMIVFPIGPFSDGEHELTLKAWDVYNNSSEKTIRFLVDYTANIALTKVYVYPNPFTDLTRFYFRHNKPGVNMDAQIHVYDMTGKRITTLEHSFVTEQLYATPIWWDGTNEDGQPVSDGVYVFRMIVRDEMGKVSEQVNKLMIIR